MNAFYLHIVLSSRYKKAFIFNLLRVLTYTAIHAIQTTKTQSLTPTPLPSSHADPPPQPNPYSGIILKES